VGSATPLEEASSKVTVPEVTAAPFDVTVAEREQYDVTNNENEQEEDTKLTVVGVCIELAVKARVAYEPDVAEPVGGM